MTQKTYLSNLLENNQDAVIIGSIGTISYDLTDIPHPNKILLRGAMGSALSVGLGYAMGSDKQVIVIIGDGSFLMKLGHMATIMKYNLPNLKIIVINNGSFRSCGCQETNFDSIKNLFPVEVVAVE